MYTKRGYLTRSGLSCGYSDTNVFHGETQVTLGMAGAEYHVKVVHLGERVVWDAFSELGSARKSFNRRLKEYGQTHDKEPFNQWLRDSQ